MLVKASNLVGFIACLTPYNAGDWRRDRLVRVAIRVRVWVARDVRVCGA